jgi:multiple RNA-binding domain-containing protein 1
LRKLTCAKVADKDLPKSRRQQKEERAEPRRTDYLPPSKEHILKRKRDETEHDPKLKEFLDVMQPPSKLRGWANEETQLDVSLAPTVEATEDVVVPEGESDDEYQVLIKKSKMTQRRSSKQEESAPIMIADLPKKTQNVVIGNLEREELPEASMFEQGAVSDADWLRSRTNRVLDLVEDDEQLNLPDLPMKGAEEDDNMEDTQAVAEQTQPSDEGHQMEPEADTATSEEDKIRRTGRLFLRNLHYDVTEDDLSEHFSTYGSLEEVSSKRHNSYFPCYDEYPDRDN